MGYPMTWQRLLNRNGLREGDYGSPPVNLRGGTTAGPAEDRLDILRELLRGEREHTERLRRWAGLVCGDVRRLEKDTLDEQAICKEIAARIGIEEDVVAAVLKEFLAT